jgi:hypothetical protein
MLPVMTAWDVAVLSFSVQMESIVMVSPERCTSRLEQTSCGRGPAPDIII